MEVSDGVWVALIGSFVTVMTSVFVPIIMARQTAAQKAADRDAEWARQDVLAERVRQEAARVADQVKAAASVVALKADASRADISNQLGVIHTLVNGKATEAMRNELAALVREVVLLRENAQLKTKAGTNPTSVEQATISLAELRIRELRELLGEKIEHDIQALNERKNFSEEATKTAEKETKAAKQDTDDANKATEAAVEEKNAAERDTEPKP